MGADVAVNYQQAQPNAETRFDLVVADDLTEEPPPSWLIDGVIERNVLAVLYGASGEGKSFVALDWALSVATGKQWQGREVESGSVVYVVAEGGRNIGKRVRAWKIENERPKVEHMFVLRDAVQLRQPNDVNGFVRAIDSGKLRPQLIVVDTLARCFLGGDENSSQDMGEFVAACDQVRKATGATVLVVHHTGKPRGRRATAERGSYALRGAADAMVRVYQLSGAIHIQVDKQKDDEVGDEICVRLKQVVVGEDAKSGVEVTSCVLVPADAKRSESALPVPSGALATLKALVAMPQHTAESGTWRKSVETDSREVLRPKTFDNHRKRLIEENLVVPVEGRKYWYRTTEAGIAMANGMPCECHKQPSIADAATATPPIGVAGGTGQALNEDFLNAMSRIHQRVTISEDSDRDVRRDGDP